MQRRAPSAAHKSGGTNKPPPRSTSRQHNPPTPPPPSSAPSSAIRNHSSAAGVSGQPARNSSLSARLSRPTQQQSQQNPSTLSSFSTAANKKSLDDLLRKATTYEEFMALHKKAKVPSNPNNYDEDESDAMLYKVRGPAPRQPQTAFSTRASAPIINKEKEEGSSEESNAHISRQQEQQKMGQKAITSSTNSSGEGTRMYDKMSVNNRATAATTGIAKLLEKYDDNGNESAHQNRNDLPNVTGPKTSATAEVLSGFIRKRQQQQEHEQRQQPKAAKTSVSGIQLPSSPPPRHVINLRKIFGELLAFHTSTCHLQVFTDGGESRQQQQKSALLHHRGHSFSTNTLASGVPSSSEVQLSDPSKDDIELLVEVLVGYNQFISGFIDQSRENSSNNTTNKPKDRAMGNNKKQQQQQQQEDFLRLFLFSLCSFSPSYSSSSVSNILSNGRSIHRKLWRTLHDLVFHYARIMQGDNNDGGEGGSEENCAEEGESSAPSTGKPSTTTQTRKKFVSLLDSYWVEKERKMKNEEKAAHDSIDGHHEGGRRVNKSSSTSLGQGQDNRYSPSTTNRKWDAREEEPRSFNFEKCLDATEWYFIMKCLAEANYPRIGLLAKPKLNITVAFEGLSPLVVAVNEIPSTFISDDIVTSVVEGCVEVLLAIIWCVQQGVDRFGVGGRRGSRSEEERKGETNNHKDFTSEKSVGGNVGDFAIREENNDNNDAGGGKVYIDSDVVAGELTYWWVEQLASEMGSPLHTFGGLLRVRNEETNRSNDQILGKKVANGSQLFLGAAEKVETGLDVDDKDNDQNGGFAANENEARGEKPTPPCTSAVEEDQLFLLTALYLDGGISLWPPPETIVESSVEHRVDQLKKILSTTTSSQFSSSPSLVGSCDMPTTFAALTAMLRGTHLALNRIDILLQRRAEILSEMGGHSPTDYILACSRGVLPQNDDDYNSAYSCNGVVVEIMGYHHGVGLSVSELSPFDQHEKRLHDLRLLIEYELSYARMLIPTNTTTTTTTPTAGTRQRGAAQQLQSFFDSRRCGSYAAFMPCVWERCFVETIQFLSNFVDTNISEKKDNKFAKYGERGYWARSKKLSSVKGNLSTDDLASYGEERNDIEANKKGVTCTSIIDGGCGNTANFERLAERIRNVEHAANSTWTHALRARVTAPEARALQQAVSNRTGTINARARLNRINLLAQNEQQRRPLDDVGEGLSPTVRKLLQTSTSALRLFSSPRPHFEKDAAMPLSSRRRLIESASVDVCTHLVGEALSKGFYPLYSLQGSTDDRAERSHVPRIDLPNTCTRRAFFSAAAQWTQFSSLVAVTDNSLLFSRGSEKCTSADLEVTHVQQTIMPHLRRSSRAKSGAISRLFETPNASHNRASPSQPSEPPHIVVAIRKL